MPLKSLHKAARTPTPALVSRASLSGLPADLLQEASRRLGWAGLIYAATFFLAYFGSYFFFAGGVREFLPPEPTLFGPERMIQTVVAMISVAVGIAVFLMSRFGRIRPTVLLDLGLGFEVIGAFGIAMSSMWGVFPEWPRSFTDELPGIPWECIWIVIFPFLAPNTPIKMLVASIAAASMGPLTVMLSKAAGLTSPDVPMGLLFGAYLFSTYLCAAIAFVIARTVYGFGKRLSRAREVGSYQLVKPLGVGGMGEVWLARHRMLARPAAVKLIRPETLGADQEVRRLAVERFEREAQATAALDSFHSIKLYDFGITEEGAFYYVMELLKGLDLETLVQRFGPVPAARAAHILRQVCHSLGEAHQCGIIHRDIKPANIYVCRMGPDYDVVKVLDFGLVKTMGTVGPPSAELTAEGVATGTPAFMAPEMALGKAEIDGRVDIYGLGCVGYWLLTGERVFKGENAMAKIVAHVHEKPIPPSERAELAIPGSLEQVIMACLEKEPDARPQSAGELDSLLAECAIESAWTATEAREWWQLHQPEAELAKIDEVGEADQAPQLLTVRC
ncbi:MAG: serine/threonine protein kinase [Gemmatimonadota bacterium]|nr:MAG: serine/threonine protein kinase [Gemmatimonadota bacterium]